VSAEPRPLSGVDRPLASGANDHELAMTWSKLAVVNPLLLVNRHDPGDDEVDVAALTGIS
jgi:hypothetical protein